MEECDELIAAIERGKEQGILKVENGRVTYPNGKSYNFNDPEEKVRARVIVELVIDYKYPVECIDTEVLSPRRLPKLPADVVVFTDSKKKIAFIVIETKASSTKSEIETGKREGLGNANLMHSKYLLVVCGIERMAYNFSKNPSNIDYLEEYRIADIPVKYGQEPKYRFAKNKDKTTREKYKLFKPLVCLTHYLSLYSYVLPI
jgi:hypothetical protein